MASSSFPLLDQILSPTDLKKLPIAQLPDLAEEIRYRIISVLSQTGGHLSSNLGMVELTIALHYVFSSPKDKFIFDVGHQTYSHKLLTGRNTERFDRIRNDNGLSGFINPTEADHDLFFSGHAGTALSLALGMAKTTPLESRTHVIPILGDAAFSCGLTLEALNNVSTDLSKFIVILNDNNMSISKNVGMMSQIFSRWLHHPTTNKLTKQVEQWLSKIPRYGTNLAKHSHKLSQCVKNLFCPAPLFEQFGLAYVGPVDGHNLKKMITLLQTIRNLPFPILFHVCTTKGKGLDQAQENPAKYHGVSANFNKSETEKHLPIIKPKPSFPDIFGQTVCELGEISSRLHVVTPAMSLGSRLEGFKQKFPERFFDVGIAESHAVTFSAGIAKAGNPVICSIYSTFLHRALDNVFHDVCMQHLPVIFAIDRAGLAYSDGRSHHGIYDMSFLRAMPQMIICQPRSHVVLQQLLFSSLHWSAPCAIRYPNVPAPYGDPLNGDPNFLRAPGNAETLSQGEDVLIIALGTLCFTALSIKHQLLAYGISATVVDPIFVKPLDNDLFSLLLMKHSKVITMEEHSIRGGLSSEFNNFVSMFNFKVDVLNFAIPDIFLPHGSKNALTKAAGIDENSMMNRILTHFNFRSKNQSFGDIKV
ncbi:1-deoxy-D-xylulose-5-phosphate synthase,1-deoxy-D-xylulose-5-phosphate synthase,Transketolase, C-terminal subunit,1-deoxy-D-xylulose-5-phosphate synthase,Transketolase, C-terminal domain [Chlamydia serpentis]|uniref:1-deoxy-D-xylulose-5-phosphate synthase n=1 Tax=Chlamydia serpentis TaxID=1967782 RepID=A0A2R8FCL8_9CHLA|nr:1-deoxy-D-xylulose-5-phosphate synthase [Chlamydia serpentis]SPN74163.1 1-deoxy-D-xylulose-5-phosphate synthase,1-deoxy-D-xylulose-5-phosphate synthase,Transketolase, C-terminal subunit,1-deoxy-D-xylulose-5-phosphate synthase,Transketolase, C-terminal domain [Chlamydia serpentis]